MANISKPLNQGFPAPSIVENYGPYESIHAAHVALGPAQADILSVGLTVGIIGPNNTIIEYWYQGGIEEINLVPKKPDLSGIENEISALQSGKQDVIQDLQNIRNGASAGATAQQPATSLSGYGITDAYTKAQVDNSLSGKANTSDVNTALATKANTSDVNSALATKANTADVNTALAGKQNVLTFDNTPTAESTNPVTSGGVKTAIDAVETVIEDCAYLGDDDGQGVISDFDPQTDTVWKKTQVLSNAEKATVKNNLGITQDLEQMNQRLNAQDAAVAQLDGHALVIVDTLPTDESPAETPDPDVIYRLYVDDGQGNVSYEDYMYNADDLTTAIKIATYALPGVDEEPTAGSSNLVKSGGVRKISGNILNANTLDNVILNSVGDVISNSLGEIYAYTLTKGCKYIVHTSYKSGSISSCGTLFKNSVVTSNKVKVLNTTINDNVLHEYNYEFIAPDDNLILAISSIKDVYGLYNSVQEISLPLDELNKLKETIESENSVFYNEIGYTNTSPEYTLSDGFYDARNTPPSIKTSVPAKRTSPIFVASNSHIVFEISNALGITAIMGAIVEVSEEGTPIKTLVTGDGTTTVYEYVTKNDCYVSVCYGILDGTVSIVSLDVLRISRIAELEIQIDDLQEEIGGLGVSEYTGKIWHCFGTSISNTQSEGKYPKYLDKLSGMVRTNFGRSGGCIGPSNSGGNYILNAIKGDTNIGSANVITIEGFVNDWSQQVPIGELTDNDGTVSFMGALNEAITYIQANSNAQIFVITDPTGTLYNGIDLRRHTKRGGTKTQNDYIEATIQVCNYRNVPCIDAGRKSMISEDTASMYIADQIHPNELGGYQYAKTIWDYMRNFHIRCLSIPNGFLE